MAKKIVQVFQMEGTVANQHEKAALFLVKKSNFFTIFAKVLRSAMGQIQHLFSQK